MIDPLAGVSPLSYNNNHNNDNYDNKIGDVPGPERHVCPRPPCRLIARLRQSIVHNNNNDNNNIGDGPVCPSAAAAAPPRRAWAWTIIN